MTLTWWQRDDLTYLSTQLHFAGQSLAEIAGRTGTPTFVYSAARVRTNLERLHATLARYHVPHKIFYALKANRYPPLLAAFRQWRLCGLDVCSPNELLLARQMGFPEESISYTGTSVSNADLDVIQHYPEIHVNCDALSTIRRLGERCPGRTIGIRINPQVGAGYHAELHYSGAKATKFGIYPDRFQEAVELAKKYDLKIKQLHFHFGSGYLTPQLPQLEEALERTNWFLNQCPEIDTLDIGGGLGVPVTEDRDPLDLDQWAQIIARHAHARGVTIHIEPGDYLVKDAGILLVEVNTVEEKGGTQFVGVNAGFNIQNLAVYYKTPFVVVPLKPREGPLACATIAGNINEAIDLLAEAVWLPPLEEGDFLALLNVGGYGAASSSNHCMRGQFNEYWLSE
ncbi:MAG: diaminopimelate decarboxylase [Anaerolineales bacterium]|nr:diaminopimelate decarboxylase [Anaerolineales bacterium]